MILSQSGRRFFVLPLVVAAVCVGFAIHLHDGEYSPGAMALITFALLATITAVYGPRIRFCQGTATHIVEIALAGGAGLQLIALWLAWPGMDLPRRGVHQLLPFRAGLVCVAALIGAALAAALISSWHGRPARAFFKQRTAGAPVPQERATAQLWFPLMVVCFLALGFWMIHSSPDPYIDVWVFQQHGAAELLRGHNPYVMTIPDIYHSTLPGHQQVYAAGLVSDDRLQFGFPYPPVSLFLATLGYAVAGDHRYAQVAAIALAGLFVGYARPGLVPKLAAALLMFTPRIFFILGRGWTEPFGVMLLAATIFCACRRSRWLPLPLGLLLATKQYMVLAAPLTFFLLPPGWRWGDWLRLLLKSIGIAAVVTLPLALCNWHEFWRSTVTVQQFAPFRWDALSYLVWWGFTRAHFHLLDYPIWLISRRATVTDPIVAFIWSTLAAVAMLLLSLKRAPRSPAGFAAAMALTSLVFFAFNKQAFCNYYFFVIGAICCAIAAWTVGDDRPKESLPRSPLAVSRIGNVS